MIRQPLEDRAVTIAPSQMTLPFPSDFMLVAAMNPWAAAPTRSGRFWCLLVFRAAPPCR
jgi:predicted ATPase with chaperone activity